MCLEAQAAATRDLPPAEADGIRETKVLRWLRLARSTLQATQVHRGGTGGHPGDQSAALVAPGPLHTSGHTGTQGGGEGGGGGEVSPQMQEEG